MNACALSMAPLQSAAHHGSAHVVSTAAKPASLPPTEIVTYAVLLESADSWRLLTSRILAPEQARKLSAYPRADANSDG
jgi:hypothetical protein